MNGQIIPMNDRKVSGRELRRRLNADAERLETQAFPAISQLLRNERVTQARIIALEQRMEAAVSASAAFQGMTLWQRIVWILRGVR